MSQTPKSIFPARLIAVLLASSFVLALPRAARAAGPTLSGTISYTGEAHVTSGKFVVLLTSTVPHGSGTPDFYQVAQTTMSSAGQYTFYNVPDGQYYLSAFRDVNGDGKWDIVEPWGQYASFNATNVATTPAKIIVQSGAVLSPSGPYDFSVVAPGNATPTRIVSGNVTYNGASTGTLFVALRVPSPSAPDDTLVVSFTTMAVTGPGSHAYSFISPIATQVSVQAWLDVQHRGLEGRGNPTQPSGNTVETDGGTFSVGADVSGKDLTLYDPGAAVGVSGSTITISGSFTLTSDHTGKLVRFALVDDPGFSSSQDILYAGTASVSGTSASFSIPNVSTGPPGPNPNTYFLLAYVDMDGTGLYNEGINPIGFFGGNPAPIAIAQSSGTLAIGGTTLVDPSNTGSISGTITIASNTLTTGRMVVWAQDPNQTSFNDVAGPKFQGKTVVNFVPGQTTYNYTISNLGGSTDYFLTAFVDSFDGQVFVAPASTFSTSQQIVPQAITQAEGTLGTNLCNGGCVVSHPVSTWVGNSTVAATGADFMLELPTTQAPPVPTGLAATAIATGSVTLGWNADPSASGFRLVDSADDNSPSGDLSPQTLSYTSTDPAVTTNTLVSGRLVAFNANGNSTTTVLNVYTAAMPASGTYVTSVASTSLTLNWFADTNPSGTRYVAQLSTNNFATINLSSQTANLFASFSSLASNTSYYARVEALNGDGVATAFDATVTTATLAVNPSTGAFTAATTTGFTVNWTANGNAADTSYGLMVSTGASPFSNGFAGNQTVVTTGQSYTFTSLSTSTVYFVELAALNRASGDSGGISFPSTSTLAAVPGVPGVTTNTAYDLQMSWTANGNSPQAFYVVEFSTDGFVTVSLTSQTANTSYDGVTPGLHALQANSRYALRVRAFNAFGTPTGFSDTNNTATMIAAPLSSNPSGVGNFTLTENWLSDNNAPGTTYGVQIATDPAFATLTDSKSVAALTASFSGLSANTAYYARVRGAQLGNFVFSAFVALPSTTTLVLPPGTSASTFSAVGTSAASYAWTSGGNPAGTTYLAQISTSASYATLTNSSVTVNTSASFSGLSPDTTYFFQVQSTAAASASAFVNQASTVTPAAAPAGLISGSTAPTSVTMSWSSSGNPATTVYELWRDVASAFSAPVKTAIGATSLAVSGLTPNTTYFFKVRALGANGVATAFDTLAAGTTVTLTTFPNAPSTSPVTTLGISSMTANWGANGNPAGTHYLVRVATDPVFATITASTETTATSYVFTGLGSNTSFYLQLTALGFSGHDSAAVSLDTTTTLANAPAAAAASSPSTSAISLTWSANGNSQGTQYAAIISTDNFATVDQSSSTYNLFATFSGLQANTSYYMRVFSYNFAAVQSGFSTAAASSTLVASPLSASVTSVSSVALTTNWLANNNGPTLYTVRIATDPAFGTLTASSATASTSAAFLGLSPSTTYYAQVRARGNDGTLTAFTALPSTETFIAAPFGVTTTFSGVTTNGATVAWGSNNGAGATYLVQVATSAAFSTVAASSSTANLTATFSSLTPDSTYFFQVQAQQTGQSSPFVTLGSTDTPAAAPLNLVSGSTTTTGVTMSWSANGNPATTVYELWRDTTSSFPAPVKTGIGATSVGVTGLTSNTTYYFKVRALGADGGQSAFDTLALGSTTTVITAVVGPSAAATPVTVGVSSLTMTWLANDPSGTQYQVRLSTDPGYFTITDSSVTTATTYTFSGLSSNTTYYPRLKALSFRGANFNSSEINYPNVANPGVATLANVPASAAAQNPTINSIGVAWSANGNAAGTQYNAQISTDDFATIDASSATVNLSASFTSLLANATYFMRVQALNYQGVGTGFALAAASSTLVSNPTAAGFTNVSSVTVTANWGSINNIYPFTSYTVQIATDPAFATLTASSTTLNVDVPFSGLSPSTTYYAQVRARGNDGSLTPFVSLASTVTFLSAPFGVSPAFTSVTQNAATVAWGSSNGAGAVYLVQIATSATFATLTASSSTANLSATFSGLAADTTYFFQVQARQTGQTSLFVNLGSTDTPAFAPAGLVSASTTTSSVTMSWSAGGNPATTVYELWRATTSAFGAPVKTTLSATSLAVSGLSANTTFFFKVRALGAGGAATDFDSLAAGTTASLITFAAVPTTAPASMVGVTSVTWNWGANGNQAATLYRFEFGNDPTFASGGSGSVNGGTSATVILGANATSYFRVKAVGFNGVDSAFVQLDPVTTQANAPVSVSLKSPTSSGITVAFNANGNDFGTLFLAQVSTDNFATVSASSAVVEDNGNMTAGFSSLQANTTYFARVQTINRQGVPTAFVAAAASSSTLVAAPISAAFTAMSSVTVTANWSANNNGPTSYTVQIATDPAFGTLTNSSTTLNTSAAFPGLSPSTTYYAQVRARGNDGTLTAFTSLSSTMTFLSAPFGVNPTITNVSTETATVAWGSSNGAGATYLVQVSSDSGFASILASSQTANLTATFGAGGQGPALTANVTYYFEVRAQQTGQTSLYVSLGSTVTPVNAPLNTAIVTVASTTVGVSWAANGNPSYTSYEVWSDVTNAFAAPTKKLTTGTSFTVSGLAAGTSTFIKVRALPLSGAPSLFDAALSTITLPPAPAAPGAPVGTALGVSSISWTWTAATFASSYTVYSASAGIALGGGVPLSFTELSLSTNTPYGLFVQGDNGSGPGSLSAAATAYTLAMPPAGTASSLIYASSATVSWSLNTNPAATLAEVQRSTDAFVHFTQVALSTPSGSPSFVDPGLIGCTTYYYRVRNYNGSGVATAFDSVISFETLNTTPSAAIGLTAAPETGNLIALSWTASPTEGVTSYKLYTDSGTGVISGTPLAVLVSSAVGYTAGPFISSAAYTFRLDAVHRCGVEDTVGAFAISPASGTLANVRAAVTHPLSGQRVNGNALTLAAGLVSGTPDQVSQVTFQYRATGATSWTTIPTAQLGADAAVHPNPALSAPYLVHWNVDGNLAPGSYDLRALAVNVAGSSDTVAAAITVQVVASGVNPPNVDVSESNLAGVVTARSYVNTNVANTIAAAGPNAGDPQVFVAIPAGALTTSTAVVVNASNIVAITTEAPNGYPAVGTALQINVNGAASTVFGTGTFAKVTFSYPLGQDPSKLEIWAFDGTSGVWTKLTGLTVDTTNRTISGLTPHFSIFQVFVGAGGGVKADTSLVRVYPNPYKPHGGAQEGGSGFVAGDFTTGIIIDNLPAEAHVKIYTISGREVASFDTNASNGKIQWDGRNRDGRDAASGGYFIVVKSPGKTSVVKKLLIVR